MSATLVQGRHLGCLHIRYDSCYPFLIGVFNMVLLCHGIYLLRIKQSMFLLVPFLDRLRFFVDIFILPIYLYKGQLSLKEWNGPCHSCPVSRSIPILCWHLYTYHLPIQMSTLIDLFGILFCMITQPLTSIFICILIQPKIKSCCTFIEYCFSYQLSAAFELAVIRSLSLNFRVGCGYFWIYLHPSIDLA